MIYEVQSDTNCNWRSWMGTPRFGKGASGVRHRSMIRDHTNYSIVDIGQNTEKSSGDVRRLDITQTPMK